MTGDLLNVMRGVAMGCADVVPGVSGGTVALIVGIYERLVRALSHVDGTLLRLVGQRQWRKAAAHLDLRFLCGLAAGVIVGFLVMTLTINAVLKTPGGRPLLLASFFGMIVASSLLVGRMVRPRNRQEKVFCLLLAVLGAMAALWLQRLNPPNPDIAIADLAAVRPSFPFLFLCATTAICAMILPGISGAMVLLMWGVYAYLADIPHLLVHGEEIALCLKTIAVFGAGCALGLLTFSKVLRWLLELHRAPTLATLAGVMLGALPQIWPFQTDLTPHIEKVKYKQFQPILPGSWDGEVTACLLVALLAGALVLAVDYSRRWFPSDSDGGQTEAR